MHSNFPSFADLSKTNGCITLYIIKTCGFSRSECNRHKDPTRPRLIRKLHKFFGNAPHGMIYSVYKRMTKLYSHDKVTNTDNLVSLYGSFDIRYIGDVEYKRSGGILVENSSLTNQIHSEDQIENKDDSAHLGDVEYKQNASIQNEKSSLYDRLHSEEVIENKDDSAHLGNFESKRSGSIQKEKSSMHTPIHSEELIENKDDSAHLGDVECKQNGSIQNEKSSLYDRLHSEELIENKDDSAHLGDVECKQNGSIQKEKSSMHTPIHSEELIENKDDSAHLGNFESKRSGSIQKEKSSMPTPIHSEELIENKDDSAYLCNVEMKQSVIIQNEKSSLTDQIHSKEEIENKGYIDNFSPNGLANFQRKPLENLLINHNYTNYLYDIDFDYLADDSGTPDTNVKHLKDILNNIEGVNEWTDLELTPTECKEKYSFPTEEIYVKRPSTIYEETSTLLDASMDSFFMKRSAEQ